jgi:hypothetical protein
MQLKCNYFPTTMVTSCWCYFSLIHQNLILATMRIFGWTFFFLEILISNIHYDSFYIVLNCDTWYVATLLLEEWEDDTHTPKMGIWESTGIPEILEFDCRDQNILHWNVFYIIEKLSKCRCWKWARMSHLDIWNTSYGRKKGQESNWQFDSRPLKVGNQLDFGACRWSATHRWKALNERYKFTLDFIPIEGLSKKL